MCTKLMLFFKSAILKLILIESHVFGGNQNMHPHSLPSEFGLFLSYPKARWLSGKNVCVFGCKFDTIFAKEPTLSCWFFRISEFIFILRNLADSLAESTLFSKKNSLRHFTKKSYCEVETTNRKRSFCKLFTAGYNCISKIKHILQSTQGSERSNFLAPK